MQLRLIVHPADWMSGVCQCEGEKLTMGGIAGISQAEDMGEGGDDTGRNGRHAAPRHGIGRRVSGKLAL
jgi:hypothetical protein